MTAHIRTFWSCINKLSAPMTDKERNEVFAKYVRQIADSKMPWLFPLLDACDAQIYTSPGVFCFLLESDLGIWHDVPEMMSLIPMVPWVEEGDTPQ